MTTREEAVVALGLDSSKIRAETERFGTSFKRKLGSLAGEFAKAFGGWYLISGIKGLLQSMDDLANRADSIGVTTDLLQGMAHVAGKNAVNGAQAFDRAIMALSVNLGEAKEGIKEYLDKFEQYGIKATELAGMNTEEMFYRIADLIKQIPDPARRAAAAFELMGKSGRELTGILAGGADAIRQQIDASDKVAAAAVRRMQQANAALADAKNTTMVTAGFILGNWAELWEAVGVLASGKGFKTYSEQKFHEERLQRQKMKNAQEKAALDAQADEKRKQREADEIKAQQDKDKQVREDGLLQGKEEHRRHLERMKQIEEEKAAEKKLADEKQRSAERLADARQQLAAQQKAEFMPTLEELANAGWAQAINFLEAGAEARQRYLIGDVAGARRAQDAAIGFRRDLAAAGVYNDPSQELYDLIATLVNQGGLPVKATMTQ